MKEKINNNTIMREGEDREVKKVISTKKNNKKNNKTISERHKRKSIKQSLNKLWKGIKIIGIPVEQAEDILVSSAFFIGKPPLHPLLL